MTSDPLTVALNRDRLNEAIAPERYDAEGSFDVLLRNEGEAVHVHLRFVGPLADVASVATSNHYVDGDSTTRVRVDVAELSDPVTGGLEVVTGHGAEGEVVEVTVEPGARSGPVEVDETLSRPQRRDSSSDGEPRSLGDTLGGLAPDSATPTTVAVVALAAVALAAAAVVQFTFGSLALTLGLLAVVVAVSGALYVLFS